MSSPAFPDLAAAMKASLESFESVRRTVPELPSGAFPAPSLVAWMEWATKAGVPAVPVECKAVLNIDALMRFERAQESDLPVLEALARCNQERPDGFMLRWDCCAPYGIKASMGHPRPDGAPLSDPEDLVLIVDDPRACDLIYEFPSESIAVLQRPWAAVRQWEGFPIEFRVFVRKGAVCGISNYYPQRSLPDTPEIRQWAAQSGQAAQLIVDTAKAANAYPWMGFPRGIPEEYQRGFEATLDFCVTQEGEVLFLEAGPGVGLGAHPCCFYLEDEGRTLPVEGLRLGVSNPNPEESPVPVADPGWGSSISPVVVLPGL